MKILNMVIPILMHFCSLNSMIGALQAAHHPTKCDVVNDVKLFPTVYHRIYCRKYLSLSNQTSHYKLKCIRIAIKTLVLSIFKWPLQAGFTVAG